MKKKINLPFKSPKLNQKKDGKIIEILGIKLVSTNENKLLEKIIDRVENEKKTFIVTPNPEFLVFAHKNPWFTQILNSADIAIPDGIGLIWAAKILGKNPLTRITGADLGEKLLKEANRRRWRVAIVGCRRGVAEERRQLIARLRQKYRKAEIVALEDGGLRGLSKKNKKWHLVFACQGMGKQERWIFQNLNKINGIIFMGIGGGIDFVTGFAPRAPLFIRKIGFEWLFRLLIQPWRWRRQLALIKFVWLVILQKFRPASFEDLNLLERKIDDI